MEGFTVPDFRAVRENAAHLIGNRWMLITAGTPESFNTMTASWGGLGVLWERDVCFAFVRPTRHTYGFMERGSHFSLSFFPESAREALRICGTRSGRDCDKVALAGLTPRLTEGGVVAFAEADLILECRKIYAQDLDPRCEIESEIEKFYPEKDYHRMYVGEITRCLCRG